MKKYLAAALICGVAATAAWPQLYNARTDLNVATEMVPKECSPAPCTMTASDLNANVTYTRVTDAKSAPSRMASGNFEVGSGGSGFEQDVWNYNATGFYVSDAGGGNEFYTFNPNSQTVSEVRCKFGGRRCQSGFYRWGGDAAYSSKSDLEDEAYTIYAISADLLGGSKIAQVDMKNTVQTGGPDRVKLVYDFAACPGIPNITGAGNNLGMARGDTRFITYTGGGQDTAYVTAVYDTVHGGCRFLNGNTMTVGGQWGPTGAVTEYDESGSVLNTSLSGTPINPTTRTSWYGSYYANNIHNLRMDLSGRWAQIHTIRGLFLWDIDTTNVYRCTNNFGATFGNCAGHLYMGFDNKMTDQGYANGLGPGQFQHIHTWNPNANCVNNNPTCANVKSPNYPSCWNITTDGHTNWPNHTPRGSEPNFFGFYQLKPPTCAWQDEIVAIATDFSQTVWRFAHLYTRANGWYGGLAIYAVSRDGKWAIFGSNWGNAGGRTDIFLISLPMNPGSAPPAPTEVSATATSAQVTLSWKATINAISYNVLRSALSGGPYSSLATGILQASYTDTTVSDGATYYYVVQAHDVVGDSAISSEVSATPVKSVPR